MSRDSSVDGDEDRPVSFRSPGFKSGDRYSTVSGDRYNSGSGSHNSPLNLLLSSLLRD